MFLVGVLALAINRAASLALADGSEEGQDHEADDLEITYLWSPAFPVAGEDAEIAI